MNKVNFYDGFVAALSVKIPKKSELVPVLSEMLKIEKESVYRRLRGDVPFTLMESMEIAQRLGISLDAIGAAANKDKPLYVELDIFRYEGNINYKRLEGFADYLKVISEQPNSERGEAMNSISPYMWPQYPWLTRFFLFRENYHYSTINSYMQYEEVDYPNRLKELQARFFEELRNFSYTYYIWDRYVIEKLVRDISYFASINLIGEQSLQQIKKELYRFLDDLENMAATGLVDGTENKFELYVSNVDIDITYSYFSSDTSFTSTIMTFLYQSAGTNNEESFDSIRHWVKSMKRVSTLISETGEQERIQFFAHQREIVDSL